MVPERSLFLETKVLIKQIKSVSGEYERVLKNLARIVLHVTVEGQDIEVRVQGEGEVLELVVTEASPAPSASSVILDLSWATVDEVGASYPPLDVLIETGKLEIKPPARFTGFRQLHDALLHGYLALEMTREKRVPKPTLEADAAIDREIPWGYDSESKTKVVTVIGAGIAGLTAAHELVDRGFCVQVVELEPPVLRPDACEVGGVAKTQWLRLPTELKANMLPSSDILQFPAFFDNVEAPDINQGRKAVDSLYQSVTSAILKSGTKDGSFSDPRANTRPLRWTIEVICHYNPAEPNPDAKTALVSARGIAAQIATAAVTEVNDRPAAFKALPGSDAASVIEASWVPDSNAPSLIIPIQFELRGVVAPISLLLHGRESADVLAKQVRFRVIQEMAAGEHGYRFFPSFYRHLYNTMERIPLYDDQGEETGKTVMDNLVTPKLWRMMDWKEKRGPETFERRAPRSLEEVRQMLQKLRTFGYTNRDVALFELRVFKYMTSCKERRRREAENKSWRDYLKVDDFSEPFRRFLDDAPLSLLAMKSMEIDARTNMNVGIQLFMDQISDGSRSDMTLNGPTSEAFLHPWMDYLRRQGVRFFRGELTGVEEGAEGLKPLFTVDPYKVTGDVYHPSKDISDADKSTPQPAPGTRTPYDKESAYYVLAIPLERIWKLMRSPDLKNFAWQGDFKLLRQWLDQVESDAARCRYSWDIDGLVPRNRLVEPLGPFRDMTGIQYYFHQEVRVGGKGHIYYVEAPWGLSSISQPQYWRKKRRPSDKGYISSLSVDICNVTEPGMFGKTLVFSNTQEVANETWNQIAQAQTYPFPVAPPGFYHLDRNLVWVSEASSTDEASPFTVKKFFKNTTPFLINLPQDWARRPGIEPYPPSEKDQEKFKHEVGQPWIKYEVSHKNWVICGPHMKTFTRMTTMEAANESARHAVNQILYSHAEQTGYLRGEFCDIWDMEECEPLDMNPLKKLDERLVMRKEALPHFVDILQLESLVDIADPIDPFERIKELLKVAQHTAKADTLAGEWGPGIAWLNALEPGKLAEQLEQRIRNYVDGLGWKP